MSAIGLAQRKHTGLSGSGDASRQEYTSVYLVKTDSAYDGPVVVENAVGIPTYGSHYQVGGEYDLGAILKSRASKCIGATPDGRHIWEVTCVFSTASGDPNKQENRDPTSWPVELNVDGEEYTDHPEHDLDKVSFETTAKERLEASAAATQKSYAVVSLTKYQTNDPLPLIMAYQNTVNQDLFYGAEPGTLKCAKIRAAYEYKNGIYCWKTSYVFHYRTPFVNIDGNTYPEYTWRKAIVNAGMHYLDANDKPTPVALKGMNSGRPQKLDANGHLLAAGAQPTYRFFRVFEWANFFLLGI